MPVVPRAVVVIEVQCRGRFAGVSVREQQQFNACGFRCDHRKIDPLWAAQAGTEGPGASAVDRCDLQSLNLGG